MKIIIKELKKIKRRNIRVRFPSRHCCCAVASLRLDVRLFHWIPSEWKKETKIECECREWKGRKFPRVEMNNGMCASALWIPLCGMALSLCVRNAQHRAQIGYFPCRLDAVCTDECTNVPESDWCMWIISGNESGWAGGWCHVWDCGCVHVSHVLQHLIENSLELDSV